MTAGGLRRAGEALASVRLAVVVMAALGVACVAATFYEREHGTAAAQRVFYGSGWFAFLLALLAANIAASLLRRLPWNRHQAGFVLAHAGILAILSGSLLSLHGGLDGRLALVEGQAGESVTLDGESLRVSRPGRGADSVAVSFRDDPPADGHRVVVAADASLVVEEFRAHVQVSETLAEAPAGGAGRPALHVTLSGPFEPQEAWLLADEAGAAHFEFGPLLFGFHHVASEASARRALSETAAGNHFGFVLGPGQGQLRYAFVGRRGGSGSGRVELGRPVRTPWMGMDVRADRLLERAVTRRIVSHAPSPASDEQRLPAVRVRFEGSGQADWLVWGEPRAVASAAGPMTLTYGPADVALPFRITLLEFHSEKYPGSEMAATYESRVRVDDPERGASEHLIAMNRPLRFRGYVFFQSSYLEGRPATSIFSVARSPGLPLVYSGATLVTAGVLVMFYLKPWLARRQGRRALSARTALAR